MIDLPKSLRTLSFTLIALAALAASIGLFYDDGGSSYTAVNHLGEEIEMFGKGLYANDSLMFGAANQGMDAVTLLIGIPLLVYGIRLFQKDECKGALLLLGVFSYFLYLYAAFALSIAYNRIFLIYIIILAVSLWGLLTSVLILTGQGRIQSLFASFERRWIGWFMVVLGAITLLIWGMEPLNTLITGHMPVLQGYPTLFTHALDMAVLAPLSIIAGYLILKGEKAGYPMAVPPLFVIVMLVPGIAAMTVNQVILGMDFSIGELIAFAASFMVMGFIGLVALISIFRSE